MVDGLIPTLLLFAPGMVGGLIRGLVGISKNVLGAKKRFELSKILFTLFTATVVGGLASVLAGGDWRVSLLVGYAGSDMLEALYKTKLFNGLKKF